VRPARRSKKMEKLIKSNEFNQISQKELLNETKKRTNK
jgi:hypothetical protein